MCRRRFFWQMIVFFIFLTFKTGHAQNQNKLSTLNTNDECIACHNQTDKQLIVDWQTSGHGKKIVVTCISCHGPNHDGSLKKSRNDFTCLNCHGSKDDPVMHSYKSSKHGAIVQMENLNHNMQKSLLGGNYRAPGCAYCHMYDNNHNVSDSVRNDILNNDNNNSKLMNAVCQGCHSPRFVSRILENGEENLNIARMKVREAERMIEQVRKEYSNIDLNEIDKLLNDMKQKHLKNVLLGAGHQSPVHQWWYGQIALDGDLLRIKGELSNIKRRKQYGNK